MDSVFHLEVIEPNFEFVLCGTAGIAQISAFADPFFQAAVVEQLQLLVDDERHDIVFQALLEEKQPPDPAVAVLKGMDTLETVMEIQQVVKGLFFV